MHPASVLTPGGALLTGSRAGASAAAGGRSSHPRASSPSRLDACRPRLPARRASRGRCVGHARAWGGGAVVWWARRRPRARRAARAPLTEHGGRNLRRGRWLKEARRRAVDHQGGV
eukprot:5385097-Prymnesium_polylepis.1